MSKWITVSLAAGLLAICPSALRAQSSTNSAANSGQITTSTPDTAKKEADAKKKGAQRREVMAILGITRADLKGLTTGAKSARLKAAADAKIAELQSKQAAGTLTSKEQSNLALLKKFEHHGHGKAKTDS
jgi:putative heme degradation protein